MATADAELARGSADGAGDFSDFAEPELEFDESGLELTETEALEAFEDYEDELDDDQIGTGRMTPEGYIDEDFEDTLGSPATEVNTQDLVDAEFKEVSRLGILQVIGDDRMGRKVIIVSACRLPASDSLDHQKLLKYIKNTLDQYVENDYVLVYFHYGLNSQNKPSFAWLKQAYSQFDRRYKKNLKAFFIVHPTKMIKFLYYLFKPFLSVKFGRKLTYVNYLSELSPHGLHLDQLPVPKRVREYDDGLRSGIAPSDGSPLHRPPPSQQPLTPTSQFGVSLQHLKHHGGSVLCPVVQDTVAYLRQCCLHTEGLFRRSASVALVLEMQERYNRGDTADFRDLGNPHLAAVLLKTFLRELSEPLLTFELYDEVIRNSTLSAKDRVRHATNLISSQLPEDNYELLSFVLQFLQEVAENSSHNKMTPMNLSIVFGPNLIWSRQQASLTVMKPINTFCQLLITHYAHIFLRS